MLLFQLYPSDRSRRVLWSETHDRVDVRPGGFYDVVLGEQAPMGSDLFTDSPRWLAVQVVRKGAPSGEVDPRIPILGDTLQISARLDGAVRRLDHLEGALVGGDEEDRDLRLAALPERIQRIYDSLRLLSSEVESLKDASALKALVTVVQALDARIATAEQRVAVAEDELEDLVGPDGDVVDLNQRMDALEADARPGGDSGSHLVALRALVEQLRTRQDQVDAALAQLIGRMNRAGVVTSTFVAATPPLEGAVVAVDGPQVVPASADQSAVVGVALAARAEDKVTVAVGGVVQGRVFGPVRAGDLLTVSEVAGHAAARNSGQGVVVGRALESNPDGHGRIRIRLL